MTQVIVTLKKKSPQESMSSSYHNPLLTHKTAQAPKPPPAPPSPSPTNTAPH